MIYNIIEIFTGTINWIVFLAVLIYRFLSKDFNLNTIPDKISVLYLLISFIFPLISIILMKENSGTFKKLLKFFNIFYLGLYLLGILILMHAMYNE